MSLWDYEIRGWRAEAVKGLRVYDHRSCIFCSVNFTYILFISVARQKPKILSNVQLCGSTNSATANEGESSPFAFRNKYLQDLDNQDIIEESGNIYTFPYDVVKY